MGGLFVVRPSLLEGPLREEPHVGVGGRNIQALVSKERKAYFHFGNPRL